MKNERLQAARQLQLQVQERWSRRRGTKDAVLHMRIESEIMDRLKAVAKAHRLSLSDFVRLRLVESLAVPAKADLTPEFLMVTSAWTEAEVMHDTTCAICGEAVPSGTKVRLAHGPPPPARLICETCHGNLRVEPETPLESDTIDLDTGDA